MGKMNRERKKAPQISDVIEDFDETQELLVTPQKKRNKLISIRIPVSMMKSLKDIASERGVAGYQQIMKEYIAKGILLEKGARNKQREMEAPHVSIPTTSESLPEEICDVEWERNFVEGSYAALYK